MGDGWAPTELLARLAAKGPQYSMAPGGSPKYTMEDIAGALAGLKPAGAYLLARVKYCGDFVDEPRRIRITSRMQVLRAEQERKLAAIEDLKEDGSKHADLFIGGYQNDIEDIEEELAGLRDQCDFPSGPMMLFYREAYLAAKIFVVRQKWPGDMAIYERMIDLAIKDVLSSHRCRTCLGTGRDKEQVSKACESCKGTGNRYKKNDHKEMVKLCGLDITPDAYRMTWAPRYQNIIGIFEEWEDRIESQLYRKLFRKSS